jgi:hypothetical protein
VKYTRLSSRITFAQTSCTAKKSVGKDMEPKIKVNLSLVHDILPQGGGGNEPVGSRAPDPDILTFGMVFIKTKLIEELPAHLAILT